MMVIGHTIIAFKNELFIMYDMIIIVENISYLYTSLHIYKYSKLLHLVLKQ